MGRFAGPSTTQKRRFTPPEGKNPARLESVRKGSLLRTDDPAPDGADPENANRKPPMIHLPYDVHRINRSGPVTRRLIRRFATYEDAHRFCHDAPAGNYRLVLTATTRNAAIRAVIADLARAPRNKTSRQPPGEPRP